MIIEKVGETTLKTVIVLRKTIRIRITQANGSSVTMTIIEKVCKSTIGMGEVQIEGKIIRTEIRAKREYL